MSTKALAPTKKTQKAEKPKPVPVDRKRPRGRPVLAEYDPDVHIPLAQKYAKEGFTMSAIAKKMRISRNRLFEWKRVYPDFEDAIKEAQSFVVEKIAQSLAQRAMGYETTETKTISRVIDDKGKPKVVPVTMIQTKKFVPPDTGAAAFILKSMEPEIFRDRPIIEQNLNVNFVSEQARAALSDPRLCELSNDLLQGIIDVEAVPSNA